MLRKVLNNIFLIDNKDYIEKAKEVGINTFLFPFKGYAFGFNNYFELDEINEENSYIYINRNLDCNDIDNLKEIFKNIKSNIKGVFFEDIGLIPVLENTKLERIIFSHHLTTNYESINNYLKYVDSVIISTDITEEEMIEILDKSYKKLGIFSFGMIPLMYSRRTLLSNFNKVYERDNKYEDIALETITNEKFLFVENEYGTVVYLNKYYANLNMKHQNIGFNLINTYGLDKDDFDELLLSFQEKRFPKLKNRETTEGFLYKKTIFKLPPKEVK